MFIMKGLSFFIMNPENAEMLTIALDSRLGTNSFRHDDFSNYLRSPLIAEDYKGIFQFLYGPPYQKSDEGINYTFSPSGLIRNNLALEASWMHLFSQYFDHSEGFSKRSKDEEFLKSFFSERSSSEIFGSEFPFSLWGWAKENFNIKNTLWTTSYFKEAPVIVCPGYTNCENPFTKTKNLLKLMEIEEKHTSYRTASWIGEGDISEKIYLKVRESERIVKLDVKTPSLLRITQKGRVVQDV